MKTPLPASTTREEDGGGTPKPEAKAQPTVREPRQSIFDETYAPEGKELRKAWSRLQRRK